jgi:hypothetical protein
MTSAHREEISSDVSPCQESDRKFGSKFLSVHDVVVPNAIESWSD